MNKVKSFAKRAALIAVDTVACPLHIATQLTANVAQLAADGVALGEGYITEKIDNTKDREDVANARVEYTRQKFEATAAALQMAKLKLQNSIDSAQDKITEIKEKMSSPAEVEVPHPDMIVPDGNCPSMV